jgi:hypothetical protein
MTGKQVGRGPYQERTKPVRVPLSMLPDVLALLDRRRHEKAPHEAALARGTVDQDQPVPPGCHSAYSGTERRI